MIRFILLAFLLLLSGCSQDVVVEDDLQPAEDARVEHIGGKHNLTLVEEHPGMKMISYEHEGEVIEPDQALPDSMRPGLDWLRDNTPEDAIILSWWDYGHAIRAYAGREPVVDSPSRQILTTTVSMHLGKSPDEVECPHCVPHEVIRDVADALFAVDSRTALKIMDQYGAGYLYVNMEDDMKASAIGTAIGDASEDLSSTVLGKALAGEDIDGLDLVFSDSACRVYMYVAAHQ